MANIALKAKYSFISALVFFVVANPELYRFTQMVFGGFLPTVDGTGVPTAFGLVLHTFVFFAAMLGLMMVPNL